MPLLDDTSWHSKIYSAGWVDGSGEPYPVVSPSTGETLATMGLATPADVHKAAAAAAEAQRDWAAAPYTERAAVLRRAGDLWHANAEEITGWLMRETGAIGPFGGFPDHDVGRGVLRGGRAGVSRRTASCCARRSRG